MVGQLLMTVPLLDNLDAADVWIWVRPSHRRRGIGTRLAGHAHDILLAAGRHVCQAQARIGTDRDNGNARFARGLGYTLANTEIERRLPLPADLARLDELAAAAAPYHRDYTIRTVVGPVPDELARLLRRAEEPARRRGAHRGHRLGMAVKCAGLRALSESFPDKRFIETTNAETTTHMVAINVALGFEVAHVYGDFQKRLADPGTAAPDPGPR
jgi:GNAT superfamily N-acetyltransferase